MIYNIHTKAIYIGVPHTGSSWFHGSLHKSSCQAKVMWDLSREEVELRRSKHWNIKQSQDFLLKEEGIDAVEFEGFQCFIVVRHPFTWFLSDWKLKKREKRNRGVDDVISFAGHLEKIFKDNKFFVDISPPSLFNNFNPDGHANVTFLKYEDFDRTYQKISAGLGAEGVLAISKSHKGSPNIVNIGDWKEEDISRREKDLIVTRYEDDFDMFEYSPDEFHIQSFKSGDYYDFTSRKNFTNGKEVT